MKKWTWVAPLLAATTLLAGCGGGDKQSEADTTPHFDAAFPQLLPVRQSVSIYRGKENGKT